VHWVRELGGRNSEFGGLSTHILDYIAGIYQVSGGVAISGFAFMYISFPGTNI